MKKKLFALLASMAMLLSLIAVFGSSATADENHNGVESSPVVTDGDSANARNHADKNAEPFDNNVFTFAVMADPQAFRLSTGGDPNSESQNGPAWRAINNTLVTALNRVPGIEFGLVNGDITELGRNDSWNNFQSIYDRLYFPYYIGLGNHDYQNNVGDCREGIAAPGANSCALNSIDRMNNALYRYSSKLEAFSQDWVQTGAITWQGSMSYSWDYKGVHFVQLQNFPSYHVELTAWTGRYALVSTSISWLREDLRLARLRGVKDIILNFHQDNDQFHAWSNYWLTTQFRAIIETFKPLVIFAAHRHNFEKQTYVNDSLFGNVTVYRTAAAHDARVHLVTYNNGTLTIKEVDAKSGQIKELNTYKQGPQAAPPICRSPHKSGIPGTIYATQFMPDSHWNIRQITSLNNVEADAKGEAFMSGWREGSSYQLWTFKKATADVLEFNSWYVIKQTATERVLESNHNGSVYTSNYDSYNFYQHWRPVKTERGEIQWRNRMTGRFLQGNGKNLFTSYGYDTFEHAKVWQFVHGWYHFFPENSRFFMAKTYGAYDTPFPTGSNSDANWQYLGTLNVLAASPCIGW